jgi:hypothetical protein
LSTVFVLNVVPPSIGCEAEEHPGCTAFLAVGT